MVSGVESRLRAMTAGERRVTRAPETMIWPLDLVGRGGDSDSSVRCVRLTERSSDSRDSQRELERRVVEVITGLAGGLVDDFSSVTKFPLRSGALVPKLANHAFPDSVLTVLCITFRVGTFPKRQTSTSTVDRGRDRSSPLRICPTFYFWMSRRQSCSSEILFPMMYPVCHWILTHSIPLHLPIPDGQGGKCPLRCLYSILCPQGKAAGGWRLGPSLVPRLFRRRSLWWGGEHKSPTGHRRPRLCLLHVRTVAQQL